MKVTKRDGRIVDYDRNKIILAIQKANVEVDRYEQVSEETIDSIVASIENKKTDNLMVEDIQDMIEQKLMAERKYELAKKYIIYRYTREMVRRANTTDDSIMSLIKNSNKYVMEENGTVMNGKLIESPKSFQVACTVMTQIISAVASSQYGGQSVDIRHLGKYLRKTRDKYERHYKEKYGDII